MGKSKNREDQTPTEEIKRLAMEMYGLRLENAAGKEAALLHADGVLTESQGDIIRSFCMQTEMNPDLKKPVGHIALSYSAVDAPKLTDEQMVQLAQEYMREMKITDTQYIIVRHQDYE